MKNLAALIRTQWDRAGAVGLVIVGLLALLAGWIGMSGAILTYEQLPYILSGGLFGLALIMMGTGLWLSADIRDEWRRIDRLEDVLAERRLRQPHRDVCLPDAAEPAAAPAGPVQSVKAGSAPSGSGSFEAPAGLVVPDAASLAAPLSSAGGSLPQEAAAMSPLAPGGSVGAESPSIPGQASAAGGARAAALASVLGTGVDAKPVYGAFAIGGILGLALLLAMRGVTGGANR